MTCPSWAKDAEAFVKRHRAAFDVVQQISWTIAQSFQPAAGLAVGVSYLESGCNAQETITSIAADAVDGCDAVATVCAIAAAGAAAGVITIPLAVPLAGIASAASALRVVFVAIAERRAPRLQDASAALSAIAGLVNNDDLTKVNNAVASVPASEVRKMAQETTVTVKRYSFPLRQAKILKNVVRSANENPGVDVRDIVLSEAAIAFSEDRSRIQEVIAQAGLEGRLRRTDPALADRLAGYVREAKGALAWYDAISKVSRATLPWGIDTAKAVIKDPSKAPRPDGSNRQPVSGGGGGSGIGAGGIAVGALVLSKLLRLW